MLGYYLNWNFIVFFFYVYIIILLMGFSFLLQNQYINLLTIFLDDGALKLASFVKENNIVTGTMDCNCIQRS